MYSQLVIIHRPLHNSQPLHDVINASSVSEQFLNNDNKQQWIHWETCIRKIAIGTTSFIPKLVDAEQLAKRPKNNEDIYIGPEAKKFLLEVVCGLHSPVRGETEVHGQYKELLNSIPKEHDLYTQLFSVHLNARKVREQHLRGLGSQSYGSLARRQLRDAGEVHILGCGALVRDMLPWLMKLTATIKIYVRNYEKNKEKILNEISRYERQLHKLQICELASGLDLQSDKSAVIVAAPLPSESIVRWIDKLHSKCNLILDYRGESVYDPIRLPVRCLSLQDIFHEIDKTKKKVEGEVEKAKALIQSMSH